MNTCNPRRIFGLNKTEYCPFVLASNTCQFDAGFFNYYQWEYCAFNERVAPTILLFIWFLVLLLAVATTADSFFAPCLVVVTRILRMSQNLAGVTLLALGNGAADVFSSLSAVISVNTPNADLSFGSIIGAGILVNTVTAGIIMIITPFNVMRRPIMKDLLFYFIALIWCLVILIRRSIELWSSLVFLSIYLVYVLVTGISRLVYVKWKSPDNEIQIEENEEIENIDDSEIMAKNENEKGNGVINPTFLVEDNILSSVSSFPHSSGHTFRTSSRSNRLNSDENKKQNALTIIEMRNITHHKIRSMNHRMIGSFAKMIIENEYHKKVIEMYKMSREIEIRRRALSMNEADVSKSLPQVLKHNSMYEAPTYSRDISGISSNRKPESKSEEKIFEDNISKKDDEVLSEQQYLESNINEILKTEETEEVKFPGLWKHFLLTVFPISINDWKDQSLFEKIISVAQSPIMFFLTLTIPVVDEGAYLRGWCKILNCLHCITSPIICITIIKVPLKYIGDSHFAVIYIFLIIGFLAALAVALTSKADSAPAYYPVFAFLGFIASIFWIYEIANEIVNVLETFGIVLGIPQTVLGISVLAFANSIGDMVSNIMLARRNFPKIAYAACIGGPLFNLLVGIGLPFTIVTFKGSIVKIRLQSETVLLIFTILLITTMNIIALPVMRFQMKKLYGTILIVIYVIFFILVILFASKTVRVMV